MNNDQKSCLAAVLIFGAFFVVGLPLILYSLLVAGGTLPPPGGRNVATEADSAPASGSRNVGVPAAQSSDDGQVATTDSRPASGSNEAAVPVAQSSGDGQAIFEEKCIACHTIGGGLLVGPDLKGVVTRRDQGWLARWIFEPDKMLAEGDPLATELFAEFNNIPMPNPALSEAEVATVLAYLETQTGETASAQPAEAPAPALPEGNAARGRALFTGATRFQNDAPSCLSCHSTTGIGMLGGGTLGPDLTNVHDRYGETGLAAALKSLPFPTMQGVFADKPLTDDEVAHLYTYFVQTDQTTAQPVNFNFVWIGLGGFIALGLLSHLTWNKRLTGVRKPLVGR